MDLQHLLVLEECLALWYHAGYSPREVAGRPIGVYLGARGQPGASPEHVAAVDHPLVSAGPNYLAANVSRFFDLHGPSVVVDTACSSALVAMNMAVQALRAGEIDSAVVGGVSLLASDEALRVFERRGLLCAGPEFHLFDRRAQGTVLGEGAGMVLLKPLDRAVRDGDSIYAVVKAVAVNNDGRTAGPAAPNLNAKKDVMRLALARSGKAPHDIRYIEANGGGTELMDLLELKAIADVYAPTTEAPCELGSMKPNIGHPLCAEGIASFIKSALILHRKQRVPFLSAREPMAHFDLESNGFYFTREADAAGDAPSVVAINSFADGGTNAHVILEAWDPASAAPPVRKPLPPPLLNRIDCRLRGDRDAPARDSASADFWEVGGNGAAKPLLEQQ